MPIFKLPEDFDRDCYLRMNPDVAAAGLDPSAHYLRYGQREGRTYKPRSTLLQAQMGKDVFDFDGLKSVHNHDFMEDPQFMSAYERGVKATGTNYQWYWRVHIGLWAAATAIKLDGDFVECGVNRGFLSSAIMHRLNWDTTGRTFYLLDTFAGIDLKYLNHSELDAGIRERNQNDLNSGFYTQNLKGVTDNFSEWHNTKIVVGADHFGLPLKNVVRDHLRDLGYTVDDMGVNSETPVDYPDVGATVAEAVGAGQYTRGILVCGTGAGMAIVANKVPGVRAVCVNDPYTAERAVASNNAQIITFGAQITGTAVAKKFVDIWLESEYQGGRSAPKVEKMEKLDEKYRNTLR